MTLRTLSTALVACFTASLVAPPLSVSAQQVRLRWKFVTGSEMVYRNVVHSEIANPMTGEPEVGEQTETVRWSVREVAPNGDATITVTTEHVQIATSGPMGDVNYDSRTDEAPTDPQAQMAAAMAAVSFTVVVGPDGTVKAVQGMDELVEAMIGAMSLDTLPMAENMLREMLDEEFFINMMRTGFEGFPEGPLGPGSSWQHSSGMPVPMMGGMTMAQTFTVDSIEEREGRTAAVISSTGDMEMGRGAGPEADSTLQISTTGSWQQYRLILGLATG